MPSYTVVHEKPLSGAAAAGLCPAMDLAAVAANDGSVAVTVRAAAASALSCVGNLPCGW